MKRALTLILSLLLITSLGIGTAFAQDKKKREKFGFDKRHEMAQRVKFKASTERIRWKMVMPWSKGLLFYDIATHFCDSVRLITGGNFDIKPFSAGELKCHVLQAHLLDDDPRDLLDVDRVRGRQVEDIHFLI